MIHTHKVLRVVKFTETESRTVVTRCWGGEGRMESCLMGTDYQFCKMKKVLEVDCITM